MYLSLFNDLEETIRDAPHVRSSCSSLPPAGQHRERVMPAEVHLYRTRLFPNKAVSVNTENHYCDQKCGFCLSVSYWLLF